jgi:hypothetical protein
MKGEMAMIRSIDMKSALIGGILAVIVLCLIGAAPFMPPEQYGRFEIETNDSHAFILDTATGQVWSSAFLSPESHIIIPPDPNFHEVKTDERLITEQ